jgi:hypothetical protein
MGITFAVISILVGKYSPGGWTWWYWMLIPAATFFGKGFSNLARLRASRNNNQTLAPQPQFNSLREADRPAPRTGELINAVPSVTEGTTRHLANEARTRQLDSFEDQRPS